MEARAAVHDQLDPEACAFYTQALTILNESQIPFLIGGAYAFERYTGIARHTKDFDIFVRESDSQPILDRFAAHGYQTELSFPHWLGKAYCGEYFVDVIFSSGNGIASVDDGWFEHGIEGTFLDIPVKLCPPEEMIWSKAFVMERERFDGADIAHILRVRAESLDWVRLIQRFDTNWRVLLSHLILFGFIYPAERAKIPKWVMNELLGRVHAEIHTPPPLEQVCHGTVLSRAQYLIDLTRWGYLDGRLQPKAYMTPQEIAQWTKAIGDSH